jgi:hypothetical protein
MSPRCTYWQILLVGEDQKEGISQLVLVQHTLQLLASLNNTITIVAVDDEDDTLGVLEVMSPQRSNLVLSSDIPHGELDVLVLDGLNVETYCLLSAQCPRGRCAAVSVIAQGVVPMVGMVVTISPSLSL